MRNVLIALILFLRTALFFCAPACAAENIYTMKVGDIVVSVLSERLGEGDPPILIGASPEEIKKYLPPGKLSSAVNVFLIQTPEANYLVDTGVGTLLYEHLAALGVTPDEVDYLLLTHSHGDHIGGMVREGKAAFPKATVFVDEREVAWSENLRKNLVYYQGRNHAFRATGLTGEGIELFPGIRAISAHGHTPGHTLFLISSKGEKLLIWGDLTHVMAIQIPHPDVSVTYDDNPAQAAETRKEVLDYVVKKSIPVAGMHIAYPSIGRLEKGSGTAEAYRFLPAK